MIGISHVDLSEPTHSSLIALQAEIDAVPMCTDRVKLARARFKAENRLENTTFGAIRRTLASMCAGACRCMYCEDSAANEVEHFRPKLLYPELVFVWLNYLYTCGPCNRVKRSHFRLLVSVSDYDDLKSGRTDVVVESSNGAALIDPRKDDPLLYLSIDLTDTFWFVPRHAPGTPDWARAQYTIDLLKLNERDYLPQARKAAYGTYRARLREYLEARGTTRAALLAEAIGRYDHPSVWAEMKAQSKLMPDLAPLFAAAPEALSW